MSREAIIRQIVRRDLARKDLSEATVRKAESALYEIACDEFGSWETALEYAGVRLKISGKAESLTIDQVQQHLRRLCTTGYDLNAHANRDRNQALYRAALHYYGTWRQALKASGVNLANVARHRPKHLDRESMILWLKQRHCAGESTQWTTVCLENRSYALAIRRTFGCWRDALKAAELIQLD